MKCMKFLLPCFFCTSTIAEIHYVDAVEMSFVPDVVYVSAGDTIHWEYVSGFPHTVTTGTGCLWDGYFHESLASFNPIVEWIIPSDAPAEIPYFCLPHCNEGMTAMIYVTHPCTADVNNDATVNTSDLLVVIDQWGMVKSPADINSDGIVNVTDLLEVIGDWGPCQ